MQSQNKPDINNNNENDTKTKSYLIAQKTLSHKDQVQAFRILACKELRDHVSKRYPTSANTTSENSDEDSKIKTENESEKSQKSAAENALLVLQAASSNASKSPTPSTTATTQNSINSKNFDSERIERLLLRVSSLKKMNTPIMEELFSTMPSAMFK